MTPEQASEIIDRHRRGVPIEQLATEAGVSHTIIYRILATVPDAERNPRIIPWTAEEDRIIIDNHEATVKDLADMIHGRTVAAVKWRRSQLRKRGELPPWT